MLIVSDRDGDWEGHLQVVQDLLPIFCESDSINYPRYESWYIEEMRKLPLEHLEVYQEFMEGKFVVKTNPGCSNAVSPDDTKAQEVYKWNNRPHEKRKLFHQMGNRFP